MNANHHIIRLSAEDSQHFYHDMTHVDRENQDRINSFLNEIDNSVTLNEDGNRISADTEMIDVKSILDLLNDDLTCKEGIRNISKSVTVECEKQISKSGFMDATLVNGMTSVDLHVENVYVYNEHHWEKGSWLQVNVDPHSSLPLIA